MQLMCVYVQRIAITRSGLHSDSHIPYSCSVHVPPTTKSVVSIGHPIRSIVAIYGSFVFVLSPAMTGSTKNGPNLEKYTQVVVVLQNNDIHEPVRVEMVRNHVHECFRLH